MYGQRRIKDDQALKAVSEKMMAGHLKHLLVRVKLGVYKCVCDADHFMRKRPYWTADQRGSYGLVIATSLE